MDEEPTPGDTVHFPDILKSRIARIMTAAATIAASGHCTVDDWQALRATMFVTTWFNDTTPAEAPNA